MFLHLMVFGVLLALLINSTCTLLFDTWSQVVHVNASLTMKISPTYGGVFLPPDYQLRFAKKSV